MSPLTTLTTIVGWQTFDSMTCHCRSASPFGIMMSQPMVEHCQMVKVVTMMKQPTADANYAMYIHHRVLLNYHVIRVESRFANQHHLYNLDTKIYQYIMFILNVSYSAIITISFAFHRSFRLIYIFITTHGTTHTLIIFRF